MKTKTTPYQKMCKILEMGAIVPVKTEDYIQRLKTDIEELSARQVPDGRTIAAIKHNTWVLEQYQKLADQKVVFCGWRFELNKENDVDCPFRAIQSCYANAGIQPINLQSFATKIFNSFYK